MTGAELCGVCGVGLRAGARFCARCGAEQGVMVPRDAGAGREVIAPTPRPPLDPRGLTIALVAYFAMLTPMIVLVAGGGATLDDILWGELAIGAVAVAGAAAMPRKVLPLLGAPRLRAIDLAIGAGGVVVVFSTATLIAAILPSYFVDDTLVYQLEGKSLGYALVHGAVVPAVVEELAVRAVILTALLGVFRERTAVLVSAMMFAALHVTPLAFPHLVLLGVLTGAALLRTRSVWPCVAIHLAYNAMVLLLGW